MIRDNGEAEKVKRALWQAIRRQGYGAVRRTERKLGKDPDTLKHMNKRKHGLRVRDVTGILNVIGVPHGVFFNEVFGGVETSAVDRFMAKGAEIQLRLVRKKRVVLPELAEEKTPDRLTDEELQRLDDLRFEDPRAAAEQAAGVALEAARDGRRGDAAAAMARQGSALRVAERWDEAWVCVWWALKHAPDGAIRANALLRSGSIVSDYGEFDSAAALARDAAIRYLDLGELPMVGRALVSQGIFLRFGEDFESSIRMHRAALSLLAEHDTSNQFAAHQCSGMALIKQQELAAASRHAAEAEAVGPDSRHCRADLHWLHARLAAAMGRYEEAISRYQHACGELATYPGSAALVSAELCQVLLGSGRRREATVVALEMAQFAMPKQQNRIVASAILELYRCAQQGRLQGQILDEAIARMKHALRRRAATNA